MEGGRVRLEALGSNLGSPLHQLGSLGQVTQPLCASVSPVEDGESHGKPLVGEPGAQLGTIKHQLLPAGRPSVPGKLCLWANCHQRAWLGGPSCIHLPGLLSRSTTGWGLQLQTCTAS